ncbi:MAG: flavodoxin domain-containing protein [Candidatus Hodarchaeales archaeon]|jgi:menaquinone-dependent protoporphyrinogen oxidase
MSKINILIAYGSRYHSTEEISTKIALFLENKLEFQVKLLDLRNTRAKNWPPLEKYDGILVGTGIRITKWTKEAKQFLKRKKQIINQNNIILGVFVSCGYASDPKHYPIAIKDFLERIFDEIGIKPDIYDAFGGVFDFSNSSTKGAFDRKILVWGSRDLSMKINYTNRNDYRDWNQIYNFSSKFGKLVKK